MRKPGFLILVITYSINCYCQTNGDYFKKGMTEAKLKDYRGAILDFSKAIELNPTDAMAYVDRGASKGYLHDYEGAIADYSKAIELNPKFAGAYFNRGLNKAKLQNYQGYI